MRQRWPLPGLLDDRNVDSRIARRSGAGNPGRLLHPAILRATGVRRWAARFRAWPGAVDEPRRSVPADARRGPLSPKDEASTLAPEARTGLTGRPRVRSPLKTVVRVKEQGLTARPSPSYRMPVLLKGLSTRWSAEAVRRVIAADAQSTDRA